MRAVARSEWEAVLLEVEARAFTHGEESLAGTVLLVRTEKEAGALTQLIASEFPRLRDLVCVGWEE